MSTITTEEKLARAGDNSEVGHVQVQRDPIGRAACTRCAELEAELEADRATLDDTRAELEEYREALIMISAAARCASDTPDDIVEAIRVDTDALRRLRAYRERVEAAGRQSRGQS